MKHVASRKRTSLSQAVLTRNALNGLGFVTEKNAVFSVKIG